MSRSQNSTPRTRRHQPSRTALDLGDRWLESSLPYLIYRVGTLMTARLQNRLKALDVSPMKWRVLSVLRSYGRLSIGAIVQHTLMEQSTASRAIATMEDDGLVLRRASPDDSRVVEVCLTEEGLQVFEQLREAAARYQSVALDGIADGDIEYIGNILKQIEKNLLSDL